MSAGWGSLHRLNIIIGSSVSLLLKHNGSRGGLALLRSSSGTPHAAVLFTRGLQTSAWLGGGCRPCSAIEQTRLWKLLEAMGMSKCKIFRLRRQMKRYYYPWLSYSIPAAIILSTGDLVAQYFFGPNSKEMTLCCFYQKYWNRERTLVYFLKGLLLVGPLLSWWNLLWFRKLRCKKRLTYILLKTLLDVFVLAPLLVSLMALIYDQTIEHNILNTDWEETKQRMRRRYLPAIVDVVAFNALTRPLMVLLVCYIAPPHLRRSIKTFYELAFAAFISHTFAKHQLRVPPSPPPPPPPPPPCPSSTKDKSCKAKAVCKRNLWKWPC